MIDRMTSVEREAALRRALDAYSNLHGDIDGPYSEGLEYDSVRQRVIDALRDALRGDTNA